MKRTKHSNQELLFSGQMLRLLRTNRLDNGSTHLLKLPVDDTVRAVAQARMNHEYDICRDLDIVGILRPTTKQSIQGQPAIVFEDPGGMTLEQLLTDGPVDFSLFLDLSIKLTDIIGRLHRKGFVHKDIHPGNIIVCTACDPVRVYLTGLTIATLLPGQSVGRTAPSNLEGTLTVMSPEQTGRMNRPVDFRTDFYSLGGVLYKMLTGRLPFTGNDPLELVHAHLAITPQAPSKINPKTPSMLSDLVLKLLAKDVDDRYRSAAGIAADLKRCRDDWHLTGNISPFDLACQDVSETFYIPDKLYGRKDEIGTLQAAFERTCEGPVELVLVTGYAGIGKTELVNQLRQSVFQKEGYFITGKCDPLDRKIPCAPFIDAISDSIDQLLARPRERIDKARELLEQTLGDQGRVLTELIPMLSLIIGDQPPVPELPPDQARNRLHLMLQRLFAVVSIRGITMVVFLDDLQWADFSTLKMLHTLACDNDLRNVLLIGAYREQEIDETHSLPGILEEINDAGGHIQSIALGAMQEEDVQVLISDALNAPLDSVRDLAILCCRKSGGNPFFLKRFLFELVARKLIFFNTTHNVWQWHFDQIARADITDNVVELMADTIGGLDNHVQQALKSAACIGSNFDLATLCEISGQTSQETLDNLWAAVQSSLISLHPAPGLQTGFVNGGHAVYPMIATSVDARQIRFSFIHDRVHEAAYGLMDPDQRLQMHLRIGRLMLETSGAELQDENIFDILGQLNRAIPLITAPNEIVRLTELNLKAGQKARAMALFESAFDYFRTGIELRGQKGWQQQYELSKTLYLGGIESAFVTGRHRELDEWFETAVEQIRSPLEVVDAFTVKIEKETANWNFGGALDHALTLLGRLGVHLPMHPAKADLLDEMEKVVKQLCTFTEEELLNLPAMENPKHLAVSNLLFSTSHASFFVNRELYILSILNGVSLLLRHGNNELSPVFFSVYASILTLFPQTLANAPKYGQLSIRLLDRYQNPTIGINTKYYFINGVLPLVQPVEKSAEAMKDLYRASMEAGTLLLGGNCLFLHELAGFCMGKRLGDVNVQMSESRGLLKRMHHDSGVLLMDLHQQMVQNLMGQAEHGASLNGPVFDERVYLPAAEQTQNQTLLVAIYFSMMTLAYFFENNAQASGLAEKVVDSMYTPPMPHYMARCHLYAALTRTAMCQMDPESPDDVILAKVAVNEQWLQSFADQASMNYLHMLHLLKAERARVEGRILAAEDHYDQAITLAEENGYLQDLALANELAAKFWMARGKKPIARLYMQQAVYNYTRWGAAAKVRQLKEKYPDFFLEAETDITAPEGFNTDLDIMSVLRASQAISGEIELDRLVKKLMIVVIENAGATSGLLLLETDSTFYVAGEADSEQQNEFILHDQDLVMEKASHIIPLQLAYYVQRTRKAVVLEDAVVDERFSQDPYIENKRPRSVLCSPIVHKEKLIGLLYLENNLATAAFTEERLKILEILSAQIAVSLENANFYEARLQAEKELKKHRDHLEDLVEERTDELAAAKEQAEKANASKSDFLARMSHEIRTPLNAVTGLTNIVLKSALTIEQRDYLDKVQIASNNLLTVINDILDFSKVEAGRLDLELHPFNLDQLMEQLVNLFSDRVAKNDLKLRFTVDPYVPQQLNGDAGRLTQILTNLIGNAIKFTETGEIVVGVDLADTVPIEHPQTVLKFSVSDTGMGIAADELPTLFDPFTQADGSLTRRHEGTGLGLAICHQLVRLMGGRIWAESTPGKGSTFSFTVSLASQVAPPEAMATNYLQKVAALPTSQLTGRRVLVVEDSELNLLVAVTLLEEAGLSVETAANGKVAVDKVIGSDPGYYDTVLMDIQMPVMNGYDASLRIREWEANSQATDHRVPIIALTAHALKGEKEKCLGADMDDYLAKPLDEKELHRLLLKWISSH